MSLSAFLRMAALERSAEVVKESHDLLLSDRDREIFLAALEKPPEPNENLKKVEYVCLHRWQVGFKEICKTQP